MSGETKLALWKHNLLRDSQSDEASMTHPRRVLRIPQAPVFSLCDLNRKRGVLKRVPVDNGWYGKKACRLR